MKSNEVVDGEQEGINITPPFLGTFTSIFRKKNPDVLINTANNSVSERLLAPEVNSFSRTRRPRVACWTVIFIPL